MDRSASKGANRRRILSQRRGVVAALGLFGLARAAAAQTQQELITRRLLIDQATAERRMGHHAQALALAQTTRARVGSLVVRAPEPSAEGLLVRVEGAAFNLALVGVPHVVSRGTLSIEASSPHRIAFSPSQAVERGATVEVTLVLPPKPVAPPVVVARIVTAPVVPPAVVAPVSHARSRLAPGLLLGGRFP